MENKYSMNFLFHHIGRQFRKQRPANASAGLSPPLFPLCQPPRHKLGAGRPLISLFTPGQFCCRIGTIHHQERGAVSVPQAFLPGEVLAMSSQAADRLLKLDSGDAALLYLRLLRHGALTGLNWSESRLQGALNQLQSQGLAPAQLPPPTESLPQETPPPDYSTEDVSQALADPSSTFPTLVSEVERRLGKRLSTADLKSLYTLYDHLALPAEVILMLVGWCIEEVSRKYGPGRKPFLSQIRKEGFIWARLGVDTMERAEERIEKLTRLRGREAQVLRLLDIPSRPLVQREKDYIAAWDDMGFEDESIRMAYERTVLKKQSMDWGYMNGILRRWHERGLHTAAAVRAGDRDPRPVQAGGQQKSPPPADQERRARENVERTRRLMEQMKQEGN